MTNRLLVLLMVCVMNAAGCGQAGAAKAQEPAPAQPAQPGAPRLDPARQMLVDLDQMDSLLNNMATQVSFIRDTNMSILLNTNVRLWSVLLRDLRLQLEAQQREKTGPANKTSSPQTHGDTKEH